MTTQSSHAAPRVAALHHVTAVASDAQANLDFYTGLLGLRLVKRTVNFDDPGTYHLYYGDAVGSPGSAMTFFPWADLPRGRVGRGQASVTSFSIPDGAAAFWTARLAAAGVASQSQTSPFGEREVLLTDPDGLPLDLVETAEDPRADGDALWITNEIGAEHAIRGFRGVTLTLGEAEATAAILTDVFGYKPAGAADGDDGAQLLRFKGDGGASIVDLDVAPNAPMGRPGAGTVHHVAFATPNRETQAAVRARVIEAGYQVTPPIDRDYFWAIYFRTPGGVLFEVATDEPGFDRDEPRETLGEALKLPTRYEGARAAIEARLPALTLAR